MPQFGLMKDMEGAMTYNVDVHVFKHWAENNAFADLGFSGPT